MGCTISLCLCFFWQNNHDFFLTCRGSCIMPLWSLLLRGFVLHLLLANSPFLLDSSGIYMNIPHFQTYPSLISACCPPLFLHLSSWLKLTVEPDQSLPFPQGFASRLVGDLVHLWNKIDKWTTHPVGHFRKKKTFKQKQTPFKILPWKTNYVKPMEKNTNIFQHTKDQASSEVSREHFTISLA